MDDAYYLGSEQDGVYFDCETNEKGWYASAIVDCNTGHFCGDPILTDDGPYPSRADALLAGLNSAYEWLMTNEVKGWRTEFRKLQRGFSSRSRKVAEL